MADPLTLTPAQTAVCVRVEAKIDEVTPPEAKPLIDREIVYAEAVEAVRDIALTGPFERVMAMAESVADAANTDLRFTDESITAPLPKDVLRVLGVNVVGWKRAAYSISKAGAPGYRLMFQATSTAKPLSPKAYLVPIRPVVAVEDIHEAIHGSSHGIELFPRPDPGTEDAVTELLVVRPVAPEDLHESLVDVMHYQTAYRVLAMKHSPDAAVARDMAQFHLSQPVQ